MNKEINQEEAVHRQLKTLVERSEKACTSNEEVVQMTEAMAVLLKEWNAANVKKELPYVVLAREFP